MKRKKHKRFRSAEDGQFVTKEEAEANPDTTVAETVKHDEVTIIETGPDTDEEELGKVDWD